MTAAALADHLWQSTLFAGAAALLALTLRSNSAHLRYGVWLSASVKFMIPFALLVAAGEALGSRLAAPASVPEISMIVETLSEPFSQPTVGAPIRPTAASPQINAAIVQRALAAIWLIGCITLIAVWCIRWRRVAAIRAVAEPMPHTREVDLLRRLESEAGAARPVPIVVSDSSLEPGVVGLLRPVLVWPRGISDHLSDAQIRTILAHELAHVRRYDNLTAAVHMVVQAVFWFHPLVWWIGSRLTVERERACDESVLQAGTEPDVYAESILKACRFSLASPMPCVSGVTGSDLKRRIEDIMTRRTAAALGTSRRLLLIITAAAACLLPVAAGGLSARASQDQSPASPSPVFEVASVKPNKFADNRVMLFQPGGRFTATNVPVRQLIANAYDMQMFRVQGGPSWIGSDGYDIQAKAEGGGDLNAERLAPMLRAMLAERFKLVAHTETRELPVFVLLRSRSDQQLGPNVRPAAVDCQAIFAARRGGGPPPAPPQAGERLQCGIRMSPNGMEVGGMPMAQVVRVLSQQVGRVVIDKTGITGNVDLKLEFAPDFQGRGGGPLDGPVGGGGGVGVTTDAPSIFTALQEQAGLKLESERAPVEVLVIDSIERPSED